MLILTILLLGLFFLYMEKINNFIFIFLFSLFVFPLLLYTIEPLWFQYKGFVPLLLLGEMLLLNINRLVQKRIFYTNISFLLLLVFVFFVILSLCSFVNDYSLFNSVDYFEHYFWPLLLYLTLVSQGYSNLNIKKCIVFILLLQIMMVFLQHVGGHEFSKNFYFHEMIKDGKIVSLDTDTFYKINGILVSGTMGRPNILGNNMALLVTYWFGSKFANFEKFKVWEYLFFLSSFAVIVSTGTRASLFTSVMGVLLCYIFLSDAYNSAVFRSGLIGTLLFAVMPILFIYGRDAVRRKVDYGDGFSRSLSLFGIIEELTSFKASSHLFTLRRTMNISKFFSIESLLFGTGIYMKDVKGYGIGISSTTDAQLLFVIIEFGIIVFLLCLVPYLFCLRDIKNVCSYKSYRLCSIMFVVIFIQTIVDQGMFQTDSAFLIFLIFAAEGINGYNNRQKAQSFYNVI